MKEKKAKEKNGVLADHEPQRLEKIINCFYSRPFSLCSFTTNTEQEMEKHYKRTHYQKEVIRE